MTAMNLPPHATGCKCESCEFANLTPFQFRVNPYQGVQPTCSLLPFKSWPTFSTGLLSRVYKILKTITIYFQPITHTLIALEYTSDSPPIFTKLHGTGISRDSLEMSPHVVQNIGTNLYQDI